MPEAARFSGALHRERVEEEDRHAEEARDLQQRRVVLQLRERVLKVLEGAVVVARHAPRDRVDHKDLST